MSFWSKLLQILTGVRPMPRPVPPPMLLAGVGIVVTDQTGRPVDGATVTVGTQQATTNADGYVHVEVSRGVAVFLSVTKAGYQPFEPEERRFDLQNQDVTITLALVAPPPPPPLERVRIEGVDFRTNAGRFRWRGVSAFPLAHYIATGRKDQAEAFIKWGAERDVTVFRVLAMAQHMFPLEPAKGRDAMAGVLDLALRHGVRIEVVALADTASYTFDYADHVAKLGELCRFYESAVVGLEIANEPNHPTQHARLADPTYLEILKAAVGSDVLVSLGAAHGSDDESLEYTGGEYVTVHADRADGDRGWRWVRHAREIQAQRDNHHHKPAVNDEPNREVPSVDKHLAMAVLMSMWGVGDTVHLASLRDGQIPTGEELLAFNARREGWNIVDDFVGRYSRASFQGDPIASARLPLPEQGIPPEQADIIRLYSAIDGDEAIVCGLGVVKEDSIVWRPEWVHRVVTNVGQTRVWMCQRS